MRRNLSILTLFLSAAFLVTACGAPVAPPLPTAAPTQPAPTAAPTQAATAAAVTIPDTAKVAVASSSLGQILVGDNGLSLYIFTKDGNGQSACYNGCATSWPPLLTKNKPTAGDGVDASLLGTTTRKDGTMQVTYKNRPLYYFGPDKAAGDVKGQGASNVWFAVAPAGEPIGMAKTNAVAPAALTVSLSKTSLGQVLAGDGGKTLYIYMKDANGQSACYDTCATNWPPLLTKDKPAAGDGVDASLLGTTARKDGSMQVTYKGMPLYYFAADKAAGDVNGQKIGGVWFVVGASGTPMQ